jgi:hypothetical protein
VIAIRKVQSLYKASQVAAKEEVSLGNHIKVQLQSEPPPLKHTIQYYFGLRILGNAYAIVGQHKVESAVTPSKQVVAAPLSVNLDYADFCLRKASECAMAPDLQLQWLQARDEHTRSRMVELMRQNYPQGEALEKALAETELLWNAQTQQIHEQPSSGMTTSPASTPSKRSERTVRVLSTGQAICKKRNDQRGCTAKERDCPDQKRHVCDVKKPDGEVCGSPSHVRSQCPFLSKKP